MISLEEQVVGGQTPEEGIAGEAAQQRRYPALTLDALRQRLLELGISEEHLDRHMPNDPEDFANHS